MIRQLGLPSIAGVACGLALLASSGTAIGGENPLPSKITLIKSTPLFKILAKPATPAPLPATNPALTSNFFRASNNGGELIDPLTAGTWKALGTNGYKYTNSGAPTGGPCKIVMVKRSVIKAVCKDKGTIPDPLPPGANGDITTTLAFDAGAEVYCAKALAPHSQEGLGTQIKAKDQFAPVSCPLTDADEDGLDDAYETDTGVFVDETDTGTDPLDADTDDDGIDDGDEVLGTGGGLDLPGLGVSPLRRDLLFEYDWFDDNLDPGFCAAHSHRPTAAAAAMVTAMFAAAPVANPDGSTGINVIHDYGQGGLLSGGNLIADADGVLAGGVNNAEFITKKGANFALNRRRYFHYVMLPHRYNTNSTSSGEAELPGNDFIVSLYCANTDMNVAHTIAHEVGHNLGLRHGGFSNCNYKPNYNSVMNYAYQFEGIDNDCSETPARGDGVLDYSIGDRIDLDETDLFEPDGTCGSPAPGWDWNADSTIDPLAYGGVDINDYLQELDECGTALSVLSDSNDWASLNLGGLSDADGARVMAPEVISCDNPAPLPNP